MFCRTFQATTRLTVLFLVIQGGRSLYSGDVDFRAEIAPILEQHCVHCHYAKETKGSLDLSQKSLAAKGGDSGPAIVPGKPDESLLIQMISGNPPEMPKVGSPLSPEEVQRLKVWIADGAAWPSDLKLEPNRMAWWSFSPVQKPATPKVPEHWESLAKNPIDNFIFHELPTLGLTPSGMADRRTLIRRLYYDLWGLPPTVEDIQAFEADVRPDAYEHLVDRLLDSPEYGERWARHWLDVVHYGDTHGYDKDKPRPNAWRYRDYVIDALNKDLPYPQFVLQQLAGDVLIPDDPRGAIATGFIAAGPWDFIGHVEVPESKIDGKTFRNLDRDDMVTSTLGTFCSVTIGCARCHDHKFDPFTQQHYYSLQAIFAAVDRADREIDFDLEVAKARRRLMERISELQKAKAELSQSIHAHAGTELDALDKKIAELSASQKSGNPAYGYHSHIESSPAVAKWVQVDLGESRPIKSVVLVAAHDDFANIGDGFGFPPRFRVEVSNDPAFSQNVSVIADHSRVDFPNPKCVPVEFAWTGNARYVRVSATKLAHRQNDYIFALAELTVLDSEGKNLARGSAVTAVDSIEAPPRWGKMNLVDEISPQDNSHEIREATKSRDRLLAEKVPDRLLKQAQTNADSLRDSTEELKRLPKPELTFTAATHFAVQGNFKPTLGNPREIRVLRRGDVTQPGDVALPGVLPLIPGIEPLLSLPPQHPEGDRRLRLAKWIIHPENPLSWRSIVNRVWHHHFGRGLVESLNDFGHMGSLPSHPQLLDWLAVEFRDKGGSLKDLHRLMVTSHAYRQSSADHSDATRKDADNKYLWRMNRRRLDAESVRDSAMFLSEKLNRQIGGPAFQDFIVEKPEHSPHYEYHLHDPSDPAIYRRSIYRFLVRSQQQPFMTTLDCADPSLQVDRRHETITPLQALALLNNPLMLTLSQSFAERLEHASPEIDQQVLRGFESAVGRPPTADELSSLVDYARVHGLHNACRLIFNLNEFMFVD